MSKRRRRRKRATARTSEPKPWREEIIDVMYERLKEFHEAFIPLDITKDAESIAHRRPRTKEEQKQMLEQMRRVAEELPARIAANVENLEKLLSRLPTFDIIGNLCASAGFADPETSREYKRPNSCAWAEFAALLCLKGEYCSGTEESPILRTEDIAEVTQLIAQIFRDVQIHGIAQHADPATMEPPDDIELFRFLMAGEELVVRMPNYPHHGQEVIRRLFEPYADQLLAELGFTPNQAVDLCNGVEELMNQHFNERLAQGRRGHRKLLRQLAKSGVRGRGQGTFLEQLQELSEDERRDRLAYVVCAWVSAFMGDTLSFTAEQLAECTKVPLANTVAYLDRFSLRFGDIPRDFCRPAPVHPLKDRPLVVHGERFLCPSPALLLWAIQPAFELVLARRIKKFRLRKHEYLLSHATELFGIIMPEVEIHTNLTYPGGELDALAIFDTVLFLLEAKAGLVSAAARRGAQKSLKKKLKELIAAAHDQAVRAHEYVCQKEKPVFEEPAAGGVFELDKSKITHVFHVALTLEQLGHMTSTLNARRSLGLLDKGTYPWTVNLYDLMVIADMIEHSAMFPHFVRWRLELAQQGTLWAHDELDFLGFYLSEGPILGPEPGSKKRLQLTSQTIEFDDYYYWKLGVRKTKAEKPRQRMPSKFRKIVQGLYDAQLPGRVDAVMGLLDIPLPQRAAFAVDVNRLKRRAAKNSQVAYLDIAPPGLGRGLTYMCGPAEEATYGALADVCSRHQGEPAINRWCGLADVGVRKVDIQAILQDIPIG